jgi:hypothetical protein
MEIKLNKDQHKFLIIGAAILILGALIFAFYRGGGGTDSGFSLDTLVNDPVSLFSASKNVEEATKDPNAFKEVNPFGYQNPFE